MAGLGTIKKPSEGIWHLVSVFNGYRLGKVSSVGCAYFIKHVQLKVSTFSYRPLNLTCGFFLIVFLAFGDTKK